MNFKVIISYSFTTEIPPPPPQTAEKTWTINLLSAILNILPPFSSLRHIAVHALSPLALWYWCNMLIQLLSLKYDVCRKEFDPKSAPCNPRGQLHIHIASFYELFEDIARAYVKTLAYTIGTTSKHQRATWPELYPKSIVFLRIVAWHMRVFSHLPNVWGYSEGMLLHFYSEFWNFLSTEGDGQETHT